MVGVTGSSPVATTTKRLHMKLSIKNFGDIYIKYLVFDYNGTLAIDGHLIDGIKDLLIKYSNKFDIYVITSDTNGSAAKYLSNLPIKLKILSSEKHTEEKESFIKKLGSSNVIAIGNGNNDSLMLKEAKIGICILQEEGASTKAIINADIVLKDIKDFFDLLENEKRLIATLRM